MSRFQFSFQSKVLNIPTTFTVNLPFPVFDPLSLNGSLDDLYRFEKKFKTLYLCIGHSQIPAFGFRSVE